MSMCAGCGKDRNPLTRDVDGKEYCSDCLERRQQWRHDPLIQLIGSAIHRALVVLDDMVCDIFGFSRRARGKYRSS